MIDFNLHNYPMKNIMHFNAGGYQDEPILWSALSKGGITQTILFDKQLIIT